jgi:hypothetical protein
MAGPFATSLQPYFSPNPPGTPRIRLAHAGGADFRGAKSLLRGAFGPRKSNGAVAVSWHPFRGLTLCLGRRCAARAAALRRQTVAARRFRNVAFVVKKIQRNVSKGGCLVQGGLLGAGSAGVARLLMTILKNLMSLSLNDKRAMRSGKV